MKKLILAALVLLSQAVFAQVQDTNVLEEVDVIGHRAAETTTQLKGKNIRFVAGAEGGVEGVLKTLSGVSSRNELSNQYNVRGGNFDENLVYINGFEVFRPFLVRAGQQEGMSTIHPHLVQNIKFSAGGFSASYGDKLSSVLDVKYALNPTRSQVVETSATGVNASYQNTVKGWTILTGFRYRDLSLVLGSTDTEAAYKPQNTDAQLYLSKHTQLGWRHELLLHASGNDMNFIPQTRSTKFGSLQEALELTVYFEGQERFGYQTQFGGYRLSKAAPFGMKHWLTSINAQAFHTVEHEITDVVGYYRLSELNNDLGSDEFGDIKLLRGVGAFHDYRRNFLDAIVSQAEWKNQFHKGSNTLEWGTGFNYTDIIDRYHEYKRIDSAGYSVPHNESIIDSVIEGRLYSTPQRELPLYYYVKAQQNLNHYRSYSWINWTGKYAGESGIWTWFVGSRFQYGSWSGAFTTSPRARLRWASMDDDVSWEFAAGMYHQHPFYREMRLRNGSLAAYVGPQESNHFIVRRNVGFEAWDRPFNWTVEAYGKWMTDINRFEVENVRIRYEANNTAVGRAIGIDSRLNGEFVKGTDSWFSLSLFRVQENDLTDNLDWVDRPTDTRFNLGIFFQDYLPGDPSTRMSLTLMAGGGFPFGPEGEGMEARVFRAPPYRRADIGFSKVLKSEEVEQRFAWLAPFEEVRITFEIFNLLQARNTVSYLWVRDVSTAGQYAVPNYLTSRMLNVKLYTAF